MNNFFLQLKENLSKYLAHLLTLLIVIVVLCFAFKYAKKYIIDDITPEPSHGSNTPEYKPGTASSTSNQTSIQVNNEKLDSFLSSIDAIIDQYRK